MTDHGAVFEAVRRGMIPAYIYNEQQLFALECDRIFSRDGCLSPRVRDFPRRATSGATGSMTRSSSRAIPRAKSGRCSTCACTVACRCAGRRSAMRRTSGAHHGWSYATMADHRSAVSCGPMAGEQGFKKRGQTLLLHRIFASYSGLIFSAWIRGPSFGRVSRRLQFYLDFYTRQSKAGLEVWGRTVADQGQLKIRCRELRRRYVPHPQTHTSVWRSALFREPKAEKRKDGATSGPMGAVVRPTNCRPATSGSGCATSATPIDMIDRIEEVWTPDQQGLVGDDGFHDLGGIVLSRT